MQRRARVYFRCWPFDGSPFIVGMYPDVRRDLPLRREPNHVHRRRVPRVRHDRHFRAGSSFQIGVSRGPDRLGLVVAIP